MLLIRDVLVAKPGMASKLAKLMKEAWEDWEGRIMTDLTGDFNTVVMETEVKSLAEFEKRMKEYREDPEVKNKMSGYTDMYMMGRREIFQIVE